LQTIVMKAGDYVKCLKEECVDSPPLGQVSKKPKMPVDLKTIEAVKALCMLKFYTDHPHNIRELGDIHFDYDGLKYWVCDRSIPAPLRVRDASIIFEAYGRISMSDCQLFTSRDERKEDEDILASCWVECCSGDTHERAHWENFCQSLKDVIVATGHSLDAPKLYKIDRDTGQTSLKVIWAPMPGWREHVCELFI
jgi:hypothetical protein